MGNDFTFNICGVGLLGLGDSLLILCSCVIPQPHTISSLKVWDSSLHILGLAAFKPWRYLTLKH